MKREIAFPLWWWGPFVEPAEPLPITRHIVDGTIDVELAAWLWLLIEAGASTVVCAGPSGAGKSTLLTSLLAFLDAKREPYFVRGRYERFESITPDNASRQALLVNEISSHLPMYLWGPGLGRAHELARHGAQLMATAHAETPRELVYQLAAFPNDLVETDLLCWELVVFLDAWVENRAVAREIRAVDTFAIDSGGHLTAHTLAARVQRRAPLHLEHGALWRLAAQLGNELGSPREVASRAALLHQEALRLP